MTVGDKQDRLDPARRGREALLAAAARHEAGHALAVMREGFTLVAVEISGAAPGNGVTWRMSRPDRNPWDWKRGGVQAQAAWEYYSARYLAEVRVMLAGPLAEARALNKPMRSVGAGLDMARCEYLRKRLSAIREILQIQGADCGPEISERFNRERTRVRQWLAHPTNWLAIDSIACGLRQAGRMTPGEVLRCYLVARYVSTEQECLPLEWHFDDEPERLPRQVA